MGALAEKEFSLLFTNVKLSVLTFYFNTSSVFDLFILTEFSSREFTSKPKGLKNFSAFDDGVNPPILEAPRGF